MAGNNEPWTVRSCIDVAGNHTCWDICLPSQPKDRGVGVVASVYADKPTAELIAAARELYAALDAALPILESIADEVSTDLGAAVQEGGTISPEEYRAAGGTFSLAVNAHRALAKARGDAK